MIVEDEWTAVESSCIRNIRGTYVFYFQTSLQDMMRDI